MIEEEHEVTNNENVNKDDKEIEDEEEEAEEEEEIDETETKKVKRSKKKEANNEDDEIEIDIATNITSDTVPTAVTFLSQNNDISAHGYTPLIIGGEVVTVDLARVNTLTTLIQQALIANGTPAQATRHDKVMKNVVKSHGLKVPDIKDTFKQFHAQNMTKETPATQICLAYRLLSSEYLEEKYSGLLALEKNVKQLKKGFFSAGDFEVILRRYIYDWSTCDVFSSRIVFSLVKSDESNIKFLVGWKNLPDVSVWMLRCCCVSFVKLARFGKYNDTIVDICSTAVRNSERFVQLGAGWVLRELSRADNDLVIQFIKQNIKFISKEGLRYATEKMTSDIKFELMDYKRVNG